jgi:hypothetical protein
MMLASFVLAINVQNANEWVPSARVAVERAERTPSEKRIVVGMKSHAEGDYVTAAAQLSIGLDGIELTSWGHLTERPTRDRLSQWIALVGSLLSVGDEYGAEEWLTAGLSSFSGAGAGQDPLGSHHPIVLDAIGSHAAILERSGREVAALQVLQFRVRVNQAVQKKLGRSDLFGAAIDLARFLDRYGLVGERDQFLRAVGADLDGENRARANYCVWDSQPSNSVQSMDPLASLDGLSESTKLQLMLLRARSAASKGQRDVSVEILASAYVRASKLGAAELFMSGCRLLLALESGDPQAGLSMSAEADIAKSYFQLNDPSSRCYEAFLGVRALAAAREGDVPQFDYCLTELLEVSRSARNWRTADEQSDLARGLVAKSCLLLGRDVPEALSSIWAKAEARARYKRSWIQAQHHFERADTPSTRSTIDAATRLTIRHFRQPIGNTPAIPTGVDSTPEDAMWDAQSSYKRQMSGSAGGIYGSPFFSMW